MNEKPNTFRKTKNDLGSMYVVGYGQKGDGKAGIYNLTHSSKHMKKVISNITTEAESYYHSMGLSIDIRKMRQITTHQKMSDNKFFVSSIVQSHNLINASHVDFADKSPSIATFTEQSIGSSSEWYFILPNTTRDGKRAIVIALRHRVSLRWEGQLLHHCSTVRNNSSKGNVHGTFFGMK